MHEHPCATSTIAKASLGRAPVNVNLDTFYQGCGCGPSATETTCLAELKRVLRNIVAVHSDFPRAPPLNDLFIAVKTSSFVRDFEKNRGAADFSVGNGRQARMIAQQFGSQSGELVKAVVIAQTESDYYISDEVLEWWNMSEPEAFEVAMRNTERATPDPFKINHATMGKNARMRAFFRRQKQNPFEVCCMRSADREERPLFVWGTFQDNHALSRLILPRVIESCAEELRCSATSLVVIPMKKCEFFVGNCESMESVWWLAIQVQDNAEVLKSRGQLVSSRPFRVTHLRNDQGLVSLEPYPLLGGTIGLGRWDGSVRRLMFPIPRTSKELESTDPARDGRVFYTFIEESSFLSENCWNCRQKVSPLMKCANCQDVKYCSKECQKESWNKGHKFECEARKKAADPGFVAPGSRSADRFDRESKRAAATVGPRTFREVKKELAETVQKSLENVSL
ncbi:hypothetical protein KFL_002510090 [Klebsormidium nitens]|uniref:MYND-type domain-containing protein n=1 Tax=Klebsormidium nitens TaxID=105231 RepID=A0A1Y1I727_KLENI|nr:hypothetical protein KFL_002510090 [Klebsormidium nitens]|eukprot:GAQ85732.1 hypothetical protein KFL_002510090 [Klebsormidium nitens]